MMIRMYSPKSDSTRPAAPALLLHKSLQEVKKKISLLCLGLSENICITQNCFLDILETI
jgi:hypothetical protein